MTIVNLYEQHKGRGGTGSADKTADDRVFLIEMDQGNRGTYYVGNALAGVVGDELYVGGVHPENSFSFVTEVVLKSEKPKWWRATVKYSTQDPVDFDDPDLDPIDISVDEEKFQRPAVQNRDAEAILTSSGTRPNPPFMVEDSNRIVTIAGSHAGSDFPAWESGYRNRINSDAFKILGTTRVVGVKKGKVRSITLGKVDFRGGDGTKPFRPYKIQLEILDPADPDWDVQTSFLDASFQRLPTAAEISAGTYTANDRVDIKVNGEDSKEPVLLDGAGQPLLNPSPSNAVFRASKTLYLAAFVGNLPGCVTP